MTSQMAMSIRHPEHSRSTLKGLGIPDPREGIPDPRGRMLDPLRPVPDELAWKQSVFVEDPSLSGRHHYL